MSSYTQIDRFFGMICESRSPWPSRYRPPFCFRAARARRTQKTKRTCFGVISALPLADHECIRCLAPRGALCACTDPPGGPLPAFVLRSSRPPVRLTDTGRALGETVLHSARPRKHSSEWFRESGSALALVARPVLAMQRKEAWPAQLGVAEEKAKFPPNHYQARLCSVVCWRCGARPVVLP